MQFDEDSSIYDIKVAVSISEVIQSHIVSAEQEDIQLSFLFFILTFIIVTVFEVCIIIFSHIDIVKSVKRNEEREKRYYRYFLYN